MMRLLFGIKDVIWWHFVSKTRAQLLSGKLSYPFIFCGVLMKLAVIFWVTENIKDFRTNFEPQKFLKSVAMAIFAAGYTPKPNQL